VSEITPDGESRADLPVVDDAGVVAEWADIERTMILVRLAAFVFGLVMIVTYDAMPYPAGFQMAAFGILAFVLLVNAPIALALKRLSSETGLRRLGLATLIVDFVIVSGFFGLFVFDDSSVHFLLFFLLPAEAALKFRLVGAVAMWAACTMAYLGRGLVAEAVYDYDLNLPSAAFRMGILLLVALVMGTFARHLEQRASELRLALHRLEGEERWRTALIDMLAHDLRTPIGTASSTLELLAARADSLDGAQTRQLAEAAARQNRRALNLADDLLEMARARQERLVLHRERVRVRGAILTAVEQFSWDDDQQVSVDVDPDIEAYVDPARLGQILVNLLSNARKHGRPPVLVSANLEDDDLVVHVSDAGDGLSEEDARTLFEPMSTNPRTDSVGLGLWIVMTLASAHGGRALFETIEGRPTFTVRLPCAAKDAEPPAVHSWPAS
jgi:signal transduction histidine kinase